MNAGIEDESSAETPVGPRASQNGKYPRHDRRQHRQDRENAFFPPCRPDPEKRRAAEQHARVSGPLAPDKRQPAQRQAETDRRPERTEFLPNQASGRELTELLRASGGRERIAIEETWDDLPKRLRAFPLTPFFCLAAILLFLFEIAERRFLLIGRFFPAKQQKKADAIGEAKSTSDPAAVPGIKRPRKRRKTHAAPSSGSQDGASLAAATPPESEPESPAEPPPTDSISAALKKARRR